MHVEHEVDERTLQARTRALEDGEARARDLRRAFEVEDAEPRAEVYVILRLEVEPGRLAPPPRFLIRRLVRADGHRGVRDVREG